MTSNPQTPATVDADVIDLDDTRHPVWSAVVEAVSLEDITAAVRADSPEWEVGTLIERAVLAALAVPR